MNRAINAIGQRVRSIRFPRWSVNPKYVTKNLIITLPKIIRLILKNSTSAFTKTITKDSSLVHRKERVSSTLYARFSPLSTIASAFVDRITVMQNPRVAISPPLVKNQTSFRTVWISSITSFGITCCMNKNNGFINECLPSQPKRAVKKSMNGKIPITSMNPISDAMPKKSLSIIDFIILLSVLNLYFTA